MRLDWQVADCVVNDREGEQGGDAAAGQAIGAAFGLIVLVTRRRLMAAIGAAQSACGLRGRRKAWRIRPFDEARERRELEREQADKGASNNRAPKNIVPGPPQIHGRRKCHGAGKCQELAA